MTHRTARTPLPAASRLHGNGLSLAFGRFSYRYRWLLSGLVLTAVLTAFGSGVHRVARFSAGVASLADTSNGSGAVKPMAFNPTMDVWFGDRDAAVRTYRDIEDTFVAEDFVMVTFSANDSEFGVFDRRSLAMIARLTERFLTIPGVRHVRSLTYNPWIRWGSIQDGDGSEEGLIISDLVEGDPRRLSDADIVRRMVATLGAERTAKRIGADRVRAVLGKGSRFADHIGEPLLLGTILDETATTTVIQVQVLRPHVADEAVAATFSDPDERQLAPNLSSIERQRAALRGIEHFLRLEKGLALPTPERAELVRWIEALPDGEEKQRLRTELDDPTRNFMRDAKGALVRKFFEYDPVSGGYADHTESSSVVTAPPDFRPAATVPYEFHLGGVPLFERNFEVVGLADARFVPLMFLVIVAMLLLVFRSLTGIAVPLLVVLGSIMAMLGTSFAGGELLNNLTMMAPNMLTAVGIADAIHLIAAWYILRRRIDDKATLITEVMRRNALPVFLTSLTTAIGFLSLTTSAIAPVQMLGTMAATGTLFAWALSMTLVPAILSLIPHPHAAAAAAGGRRSLFAEDRVARFVDRVVRRRRAILAATGALALTAVVGLFRMEIDSDFRGMFPDDNPTMSDFNWIEGRLGGVGDMEIVFYGHGAGAPELSAAQEARLAALALRETGALSRPQQFAPLTAAESTELAGLRRAQQAWNASRIGVSAGFLDSLDRFETRLRQEMADPASPVSLITDLVSPLDTLRKVHQVQNQNAASAYRVPGDGDVPEDMRRPSLRFDEITEEWSMTPAQDGSTLAAQYYLQYENGARPGESLSTQLSADRRRFRMEARIRQASSATHLRAFARVEEIARTEFPELAASVTAAGADLSSADMVLSGKTLLFARTSDLFANGFAQSMGIAIVVITLLIGVIFRSVRFALISLVPNVLPILLPLSVFGLLGVPIDGPAVLVSSVALGVCVDDTIHFFTKFDRGRRAGLAPRDALVHALTEAGAAMSFTTIVLIVGFGTLLLSDFAPNFQMGALAAAMIALAWVADFVVTTAILSHGNADTAAAPAPQDDTARTAPALQTAAV